jgi:iron complex outermembrane receptor protein
MSKRTRIFLLWLAASLAAPAQTAQNTGTVRGTVTLAGDGTAIRHAMIYLTPAGWTAETNAAGEYVFERVPPGEYTVVAHAHGLGDEKKTAVVKAAGGEVRVDFAMRLSPIRETVTVTATGRVATVMESFQTVTALDGAELNTRSSSTSLGELLERETGIAKRSFGPGTSRPVIRGFDGDRVLIMQDGLPTGTLSYQSGDHGEPVDSTALERVEVVRGPATLLYGSNAVGGVVNLLTDQHILDQHPHDGLNVTLNAVAGTTNAQAGGSGSFAYGRKQWMLTGSGGGMRMGDYGTPLGPVLNSFSNMRNAAVGGGRFGRKVSFVANYALQEGDYGLPVDPREKDDDDDHDDHAHQAGALTRRLSGLPLLRVAGGDDHHDDDGMHVHEYPVSIRWRRHNLRFQGTIRDLGQTFEQLQIGVNYSDWNHNEVELGVDKSRFFNKQLIYRAALMQKRRGRLTGTMGAQGIHRDYHVTGAKILGPPVRQDGIGAFILEEISFERVRFQFGGRFDHNAYNAVGRRDRTFTGASASAGVWVPLWEGGAAVANFMHSFRTPALEELYHRGPHMGLAVFEVGNENLVAERGNGAEISVRHQGRRLRAEANIFRHQLANFVFLNPTGVFDHGLPVANYEQAGSRFMGAEMRAEIGLRSDLWLLMGFDTVDANITAPGRMNLPRIPPTRGRLGFDWRWKGLMVRPEVQLANRQWQIAPYETPTAGFAVAHVTAAYTVTRGRLLHTFRAESFNINNQLYRNHLAFIKDFAPEIGRGIRCGYTLQWF